LSLPKGGLNDKHAMILTVGHIRSMVEASEEIRNEINQFKDSYVLMCDQQGQSVFTFERNFKTSHLQLQLIPVPKEKAKALKAVLISEADRCGLEFCFVSFKFNMYSILYKSFNILCLAKRRRNHVGCRKRRNSLFLR
jgi:hypothetical protein